MTPGVLAMTLKVMGFDASSGVVILTQETAALADVSPAWVSIFAQIVFYRFLPFLFKGKTKAKWIPAFRRFLFKGKTKRQNGYLSCPQLQMATPAGAIAAFSRIAGASMTTELHNFA
ncbi:MAG: hypothetical protein LBH29_06615 [Elusimicrobiota bacterium]|jgi:hypothetical protein|nr:hypothetical protein [Elusimicrobiota bacterium]